MSKTTAKLCYRCTCVLFFSPLILQYMVHVREADQSQLNLNIKCRSLRVQLKIPEGLKWRQEANGATELESDGFIVSLEAERGWMTAVCEGASEPDSFFFLSSYGCNWSTLHVTRPAFWVVPLTHPVFLFRSHACVHAAILALSDRAQPVLDQINFHRR